MNAVNRLLAMTTVAAVEPAIAAIATVASIGTKSSGAVVAVSWLGMRGSCGSANGNRQA